MTLLALPALPLMLIGSGVTAALGLLWGPLGLLAGWAAWAPLSYLLGLVRLVDSLPGIVFDVGPVAPLAIGAFYATLLLLVARRRLRRLAAVLDANRRPALAWVLRSLPLPGFRLPAVWGLPPVGLAAAVLWAAAMAAPDGRLHVTVLDVGQGDAIFVVTPSGRQLLVDGGPDRQSLMQALGGRIPFWDRSLDVVVLTHAHQDHLEGLVETLRRYQTDLVVQPATHISSPLYAEWLEARASPERVLVAQAGQEIHLGDGVRMRVLGPGAVPLAGTTSDIDNNSVVLRLEYGEVSFLLTGDIYTEAESALLAHGSPLGATVLKVPHHGSGLASSSRLLASVAPHLAVVSAGSKNPFGHPHPQTVARLQEQLAPGHLLLTSERGSVTFTTDGTRLWLATER